jgi:hypothetical protein
VASWPHQHFSNIFGIEASEAKIMNSAGKTTYSLTLALLILFAGTRPAHAYLDPGTLNMALQIVVGAVVGGLVAMKIYWHKLLDLLGLNSQKRKYSANDKEEVKK